MTVHLEVRNDSPHRHTYRRDNLRRLAERVCAGEGCPEEVELSVLFCTDPFIAELNGKYRDKPRPTDVLSFSQEGELAGELRVLGDIVISLDTVARYCAEALPKKTAQRALSQAMRDEVRLLFCHGLLHLLGYDHGTAAERRQMQEKQAHYLDWNLEAAWRVRGGAG